MPVIKVKVLSTLLVPWFRGLGLAQLLCSLGSGFWVLSSYLSSYLHSGGTRHVARNAKLKLYVLEDEECQVNMRTLVCSIGLLLT